MLGRSSSPLGRHPDRRRHPVPASTAQREGVRRSGPVAEPTARQRFHRRAAARRCRGGSATSCTPSSRTRPDDGIGTATPAVARRRRAGTARRGGAVASRPHVVVVGAGIAGLAAATGLAERGVTVDVVERETYLGGRVGGWARRTRRRHVRRDEPRLPRVLSAVLQPARPVAPHRSRAAHADRRSTTIRWSTREGRRDTFRGLPLTPPLECVGVRLAQPHLSRCATWSASTPAPRRRWPRCRCRTSTSSSTTSTPRRSFENINFPDAARHLAFEVFSRSFFAEPDRSCRPPSWRRCSTSTSSGPARASSSTSPTRTSTLACGIRCGRYLSARGVQFHTGVSVTAVDVAARLRRFDTDDGAGSIEADGVVLATDVAGLVNDRRRIARARRRRVAGAHRRSAHRAAVRRAAALAGPSRRRGPARVPRDRRPPPLDNVSVVERYERRGRRVGTRSRRIGRRTARLRRHRPTMHELRARLLDPHARALSGDRHPPASSAKDLCRKDCPRFAPGDFADPPRVSRRHIDGLALAGDGIRIDLPVALMERAATTGWSPPPISCLSHWGIAGHACTPCRPGADPPCCDGWPGRV